MSTAPNTKNQHYVWQHYLNAWVADGTFCCYRQKDKKLFRTRPKVVASETYDPPSKWWTPLISSYWSWKGV
jgi:hypothetical protein